MRGYLNMNEKIREAIPQSFDAIILAGGRNTRIGRNKALLLIDNVPVIERVVRAVEAVVSKIIVVLKKGEEKEVIRCLKGVNVQFVLEGSRFRNPIIGIYHGLLHSKSNYVLVLPCDTPFVNVSVLKYLLDESNGFDLTIPRWSNGYLEPLCAVYRKEVTLSLIKNVENLKGVQIKTLITQLPKIRYVSVEELKKFDESLLTFYNINTIADYEGALRISVGRSNLKNHNA